MILFGTTETKSCEVGGVFDYGEIVALNASGKAVRYVPSTDGQIPVGVAYRNVYSSLGDVNGGGYCGDTATGVCGDGSGDWG